MKTVVTLWLITAFLAVVGWQIAISRGNTIDQLKISLKQCERRIDEDNEYIKAKDKAAMADSKTIGELREKVKQAPSICDCYHSRADSPVLNILHDHHKTKR